MPKMTKRPLTEEEKLELDIQVENELARLQRQMKVLDRNRSKLTGGGKLGKQRRMIQILQKEKTNLDNDLHVATSDFKKKLDTEMSVDLMELLDDSDFLDAQINRRKAHLREIDTQITKMKKDVTKLAAKQTTDIQVQNRLLAGQKVVECLENKLEVAVKTFCSISTENFHLRQQIDHLLIERANFNKLWELVISNLNKGKSFMVDLIEQSTIAYDQRDEWISKLNALRSRAYSDLIMQTQEMQDLQRKLDHEKKLKEFMAVKGQRRLMQSLFEKQQRKKNEARDRMQSQLGTYKKIFDEITNFTGFNDLEALAKTYVRQEEENFSMFNYFNTVYKEVEDVADNLVDLYKKIDAQLALNETRTAQQSQTLTKLTNESERAKKAADARQDDLNKTQEKLQKLYAGIEKLFKICKCDNAPFMELLGENSKINDYNILLFLEMLEQKISEIIVAVYYKQKTTVVKAPPKEKTVPQKGPPAAIAAVAVNLISENVRAEPMRLITTTVPTNPCPLCVEQEQVSDIIDELQFVHEKNEVVRKLAERLALPDGLERLHNVSACHLPKSRQIIQKRYQ